MVEYTAGRAASLEADVNAQHRKAKAIAALARRVERLLDTTLAWANDGVYTAGVAWEAKRLAAQAAGRALKRQPIDPRTWGGYPRGRLL